MGKQEENPVRGQDRKKGGCERMSEWCASAWRWNSSIKAAKSTVAEVLTAGSQKIRPVSFPIHIVPFVLQRNIVAYLRSFFRKLGILFTY